VSDVVFTPEVDSGPLTGCGFDFKLDDDILFEILIDLLGENQEG
jgi:hypothetical protein